MNFYSTLGAILAAGIMASGFTYAVLVGASLPDVWFSHSTNECVKIGRASCRERVCQYV